MNRCQSLNQRVPRTRSRTRTRTAVCRARHPSPGGVGRSSGPGCIHTKSILNPDVPKIIHSTPIFARSTRFVSSLNIPQRFVSKRQQERSFHPPLPPRARRRPGRRPVVGVGVVGAHAAPRLATTTIAPVVSSHRPSSASASAASPVDVGVGAWTDGWIDRRTTTTTALSVPFRPRVDARRDRSVPFRSARSRSTPPSVRRPPARRFGKTKREDIFIAFFNDDDDDDDARGALGLHTRAKGAPSVRTLFRAKSNGARTLERSSALTQLSTRRVPAR